MRRLLSLSLLLAALTGPLHAQQTGNPILERLQAQVDSFTQETIYLHTDTDEYRAGGRIWLKAYLVDARQLINLDGSRYVYVEWITPEGNVAKRIKIMERGGLYAGYLDIPEDTPSGLYILRAYTRYMGGYGKATEKTVQVGAVQQLAEAEETNSGNPLLEVRREGDVISLSTSSESSLYLIGLCRKEAFFLGGLSAARPVAFPESRLPEGRLEFLLADRSYKIVGHAEVTVRNGERMVRIGLEPDKTDYRTGEQVRLKLDVSALGEGEIADLSLSVCRRLLPAMTSIRTELLDRNPGPSYVLQDVLQGIFQEAPRAQEQTQVLSGEVRTQLRARPVAGAHVSLISPQAGMFDLTQTDEQGKYSFTGLDFPEGTHYIVKSTDEKGTDRYSLKINDETWPVFEPSPTRWIPSGAVSDLEYGEADADAIALEGTTLTATQVDSEIRGFSKLADFSFGPKQIEEMDATCLHEVLRRAPGVFIRTVPDAQNTSLMGEKVYIRANVSILGDVPAAIAIDGVILDEDFDLDQIEMPNVDRVDIFKTGQTAIWGTRAGGGLISITTKKGDFDPGNAADKENLRKAFPLGYQRRIDFSPSSRTLWWEPSILSDRITFPAGSVPGTYTVTLEGVTSLGRLIHEEILVQIR